MGILDLISGEKVDKCDRRTDGQLQYVVYRVCIKRNDADRIETEIW